MHPALAVYKMYVNRGKVVEQRKSHFQPFNISQHQHIQCNKSQIECFLSITATKALANIKKAKMCGVFLPPSPNPLVLVNVRTDMYGTYTWCVCLSSTEKLYGIPLTLLRTQTNTHTMQWAFRHIKLFTMYTQNTHTNKWAKSCIECDGGKYTIYKTKTWCWYTSSSTASHPTYPPPPSSYHLASFFFRSSAGNNVGDADKQCVNHVSTLHTVYHRTHDCVYISLSV